MLSEQFYIIGEEVLYALDSYQELDGIITDEEAAAMIEELKTKLQELKG